MPIKIPNNLPGTKILERENVPIICEERAIRQDIRPLQVLILNLMPDKIGTETQLLRGLGASPLQLDVTFMHVATHQSKHTPEEHLAAFYKTHEDIKDQKFDAMLITGAPLGLIDFEEVTYWDEVKNIFDWAETHVFSRFFICWGALAGLYHFHDVPKHILPQKKSGVFKHIVKQKFHVLTQGFDDYFNVPVSRNTEVRLADVAPIDALDILVATEHDEPCIVYDNQRRDLYIFSHLEYDAETLKNEYQRDVTAGLSPQIPDNYFPNDNPDEKPGIRWRAHRTLLFTNWINMVYQETPYDLNAIGADR